MRFNVAFGIMLGLALAELLLLQVAVRVDGHVITPPPVLPTTMTGASDPRLAKRENKNACDVAGVWNCANGFYCFVSDDYLGCCPISKSCTPHTACVAINGDDLESVTRTNEGVKSCLDAGKCGVCSQPDANICVAYINAALSHTMLGCNDTRGARIFTRSDAILRSDISVYTAVQIVYSTITAAAVPPPGGEVITVKATGASPTYGTSPANGTSPTNGTSAADTNKQSGSSHAGTAKAVGISIGVVATCGIVALSAWWAYRRHHSARENQGDSPQQSSGAGPHRDGDTYELDNTSHLEVPDNKGVQHSPSPGRSELDATPTPGQLASNEVSVVDMAERASSAPVSPLDTGLALPPSGLRSPVSPLEPPAVKAQDFPAGRYGPGGFLNPEYALRDGLWHEADRRQVLA